MERNASGGKLTDDDLDVIRGDCMKLAGLLQEPLRLAKDELDRDTPLRAVHARDTGTAVGMKPWST